jgi:SAM-dependent methyltransferase
MPTHGHEPHGHATDQRWLAAAWPFVRDQAPPPPATVVEIGCGALGGFVPMLRSAGYDAVGVDPEAPPEAGYHRDVFETYEPAAPVDALVASLSLHHVADLDAVLDRMADAVRPAGTVIVIEWAWERFDERTAQWCFDRLGASDPEPGWLHRRRQDWLDSQLPWDDYVHGWATTHGMHRGGSVVAGLQRRFGQTVLEYGPYYFPDLEAVTETEERDAIDAGLVQPARILFVGRRSGRVDTNSA